mmetsp:Transcript_73941/g.171534  ORF Transcript_73941/g.171534 Transcript_73941/m.171534 type:complete len:221 (-) Transcript_73941:458-1120(-)
MGTGAQLPSSHHVIANWFTETATQGSRPPEPISPQLHPIMGGPCVGDASRWIPVQLPVVVVTSSGFGVDVLCSSVLDWQGSTTEPNTPMSTATRTKPAMMASRFHERLKDCKDLEAKDLPSESVLPTGAMRVPMVHSKHTASHATTYAPRRTKNTSSQRSMASQRAISASVATGAAATLQGSPCGVAPEGYGSASTARWMRLKIQPAGETQLERKHLLLA